MMNEKKTRSDEATMATIGVLRAIIHEKDDEIKRLIAREKNIRELVDIYHDAHCTECALMHGGLQDTNLECHKFDDGECWFVKLDRTLDGSSR